MAASIVKILEAFRMTPGQRAFIVVFPVNLEVKLEHEILAARGALRGITSPCVKYKVDGMERPRKDQKPLPVVLAEIRYAAKQGDGEVLASLCAAVTSFASRLNLNEVEPVVITEVASASA